MRGADVIAKAHAAFPGARGYFNTAAIGLPPRDAADELRMAIDAWQAGAATAPGYDRYIDEARALFADLVHVTPDAVAISSQVSALVGMIAAGLPSGANVLCPEGEFTSVLFPFLARDDLNVRLVPLEHLPDSIDAGTDLVAFSLVQSADGCVARARDIAEAAQRVGARTLVDGTQAAGWLPLDAGHFDITVTGTYKWLLSPRGTAFMTVRQQAMDLPIPVNAGWYAGEAPWDAIYGAPLRLAADARRFDLSPGWLAWVGTAAALRFLRTLDPQAVWQHNVGLANAFRRRVGLAASDSAIVSCDLPSTTDHDRLGQLSTSNRAGRLRVAFHLYNDQADLDALTDALGVPR
ncbi:MAG: aminotransferase class V-fold PLP-dependent enzyme [Pseudomonadota bacterium]